jgi:hypothetical protein
MLRSLPLRPLRAIVLLLAVLSVSMFAVGVAPAQAKVTFTSYLTFDKNPKNPQNSRLTFQVYRTDLDPPRRQVDLSFRAGSGLGSTNDCASGRGWLPNGWYTTKVEKHHNGKIHGVVVALPNKKCSKGTTTRTELFIHSEMTTAGGQSCKKGVDLITCWEGNNDYKSNGCIKLKPADVKTLADYLVKFPTRLHVVS